MTNQTPLQGWIERNVKIIPSLVVGAGGTGVSVIRHLKRRVRLDWPGVVEGDTPELIQFYGVDTVSYSNRPDQEFLSQDEYGFLGGFDPQQVIQNNRAVNEWWDAGGTGFNANMLPPGIIHLGARQIRALGRVALFHAFPDVWGQLKFKLDKLLSITAEDQAIRVGYTVPVEKSARQVFIVSSICGGTGAGCFLDLAARIRERETTRLKITGILVMPSAFAHTMPSRRQDDRIRANAFAALKELDTFWYEVDNFRVRYPGEALPIQLQHALFDEIYLIGSEGLGKRLSTLDDVNQQIAHFVYLNSMNNLAGPVGERVVNLDRTQQFYSCFSVGALVVPQSKVSDSTLADLKSRYLYNLIDDQRHITNKADLDEDIARYLSAMEKIAETVSTGLEGLYIEQDDYNQRARQQQGQIVRKTTSWLVETIIPSYGLRAIETIRRQIQEELEDVQDDIEDWMERGEQAQRRMADLKRSNRLGRFGEWTAIRLRLETSETYEARIEEAEAELAVLRLLVPDRGSRRAGKRLLSFVLDVVDTFASQIDRFLEQARPLVNELERERDAARYRSASEPSLRGAGREASYYEMEVDPTVEGQGHAFQTMLNRILVDGTLEEAVTVARTLQTTPHPGRTAGIVPPRALQLAGFVPQKGSARPKGHITEMTDVTDLISADDTIKTDNIDIWEINNMLDELIAELVHNMLEQHASLISFFQQSENQQQRTRRTMRKPIEAMIDRIMNHVQRPFWGANPYPDERNLESFMFLCMTADPGTDPGLREFFRKYQNSRLQFIRGTNPYRLDALRLEHAARLKDIAEVWECRAVYETFPDKESLHIKAEYVQCPDPTQ